MVSSLNPAISITAEQRACNNTVTNWTQFLLISLVIIMPRCVDFTVDEAGSAEPTRDKNIIGTYRRRGSSPPVLFDPGWVV